MLLGAIADDLTGATDLANVLAGQGLRTGVVVGLPKDSDLLDKLNNVDAVVIALKSRTIPANEAVELSLSALHFLREAGAAQILFKYCSTFDSTPAGNIGPVADALLDALEADFTIACPALPENGRTVYNGHLFVHRQLLSDSPLRDHPLTPMTEANLVKVLGRQTPHAVGIVPYTEVAAGPAAIRKRLSELRAEGYRHAIVDAVFDRNLLAIGESVAKLPLVTGGAGIALGLVENHRRTGLLHRKHGRADIAAAEGGSAVIAGSCSAATLEQIEEIKTTQPSFRVDPCQAADGEDVLGAAIGWAKLQRDAGPLLFYASAPQDELRRVQEKLGTAAAAELVERLLAEIATALVKEAAVRQLVIAGGETSGAVIQALDVPALRIGQQIDPGVPWTESLGELPLALALKSGNFGSRAFFRKAFEVLG